MTDAVEAVWFVSMERPGWRAEWDTGVLGSPDPRAMLPTRRPTSGDFSRHIPHRAYSVTTGGALELESGLEYDVMRWLDGRPERRRTLAEGVDDRDRPARRRPSRHSAARPRQAHGPTTPRPPHYQRLDPRSPLMSNGPSIQALVTHAMKRYVEADAAVSAHPTVQVGAACRGPQTTAAPQPPTRLDRPPTERSAALLPTLRCTPEPAAPRSEARHRA